MAAGIPKISVIIPCYNAAATIHLTLDSVLNQTFKAFEVIVVNDGSTDQTRSTIESYVKRFEGKLKLISQNNKGQAVAKNLAIQHSNGEFIAFLDSDDLWAPEKLEKQYYLMKSRPNLGICYTEGFHINENGDKINSINASATHAGRCFNELLVRNNIVASSVMVRHSVLEDVGVFDAKLAACENWDLWIRISKKYEIDFLANPLTYYRVHRSNMSKDLDRMKRARMSVIAKHLPDGSDDPWIYAKRKDSLFSAHLTFAKAYIENLELRNARHELRLAIRNRPKQHECYYLYLKTLMGRRLFKILRRIKRPINS